MLLFILINMQLYTDTGNSTANLNHAEFLLLLVVFFLRFSINTFLCLLLIFIHYSFFFFCIDIRNRMDQIHIQQQQIPMEVLNRRDSQLFYLVRCKFDWYILSRRPVREEYDFFNNKPQQHRRGPTKETDLDRGYIRRMIK
jgi:hypothetical protein